MKKQFALPWWHIIFRFGGMFSLMMGSQLSGATSSFSCDEFTDVSRSQAAATFLGALCVGRIPVVSSNMYQNSDYTVVRAPRNPVEPGGSFGQIPVPGTVDGAETAAQDFSVHGSLGLLNNAPLRLYEVLPGTDYIELRAPVSLATSYALVLPIADGTSGQVLTTDGNGQLSWSSGGIPADVVLIGGNNVTGTMDIGTNNGHDLRLETDGVSRLSIASGGTVTVYEPVVAQNTIQLEDQHALIFEDTGSNTVALRAPTSVTTSYTLSLPIGDGATGEVLTTNGAGQLSWSTAPAPSGAVLLGGNAVASTMEVGTLTNQDFALFSNGLSRLVIGSEGVYAATVDPGTGLAVIMDNTGKIGTTVSSRRFKEDIVEIGEDQERFAQLRPVRYHLKRDYSKQTLYGFVAEELVEVYPELVVLDDAGKPLGIKEYLFAGILVNEMQRLARHVESLTERLAQLESLVV